MSNNAVISTIFNKENSWRNDSLDLLVLFAQLAAINVIQHRCLLARMRRGWEAYVAISVWGTDCCYCCVFIAHECLAVAVSNSQE